MMDGGAKWLKRENRDWEKVYSERSLAETPGTLKNLTENSLN